MPTTALALRPNADLTAPTITIADDLATLVDNLLDTDLRLGQLQCAEEEIQKARARHPERADLIWHSFTLLTPPAHRRMKFDVVYRAHCAELLDRVAVGEDTRPGTAAEVCCAMLEVSLMSPLTSAAGGLYMRMWLSAGLPDFPELAEASRHHEALERSVIDDHEQFTRRRLAVADRRLGKLHCTGTHHGYEVNCAYAPPAQLAIEV